MIKKICLMLMLTIMLCSCNKVAYVERQNVDVEVIKKEYHAAFTSLVNTGKSVIPIRHPERNYVYVRYKDIEECVDNKRIYDACEIGSVFSMVLLNKYDGNNEIIKQELLLEE